MLRQRKLRDRLVAMAAPPILIAAVAAVGLVAMADSGDGSRIGLIALGATVLIGAWSYLIGWTIIRSVNSLAIASTGLAEAQARIANGELEATELPGIDHDGPDDEIGRVAASVNAISRSAVELAHAQRESIRKGLATIVINLARRNQSLLDRQVEFLDKLEQSEEDPDRLAELFRVDHLATRMRRNAESLLVLAGADTVKRKGAPVAMSDVLRVAIGEVENYRHIELGVVEDGEVPAGVAVDLAHMTAELMENATQFSPPSTTVEVSAIVDRTQSCVTISVTDRGMGLGDRLELANETLANPPELGLGMGRSLGFMVVGRLASRLGAAVHLRANEGGGTIAEVNVPLSLFQLDEPEQPEQPEPQAEPQVAAAPPPAQPVAPAAEAPAPTPAPAAAPTPEPEASQAVASTTLEKLLGIGPKTESAPAPAPQASTAAPAPSPAPAPAPAPTAAVEPEPAAATDWQQASPFGESIGGSATDHGQTPLPPPADDPTWASMTVDSGPAAEAQAWVQPQSPNALVGDQASPAPAPTPAPTPAAGPPPIPPPEQSTWTPPPVTPSAPAAERATWAPPALDHPPAPAEPMPPVADAPTWAPPPVTPPPPSRLEEAVPSGEAFETGVASLLDQPGTESTGWPETSRGTDESSGRLQKRQPGASNVPIGQGRPVAAPSRSPEEVRAMLSRYREGLKGGANHAASASGHDQANDTEVER